MQCLWPGAGIGRQLRLKNVWEQSREGSSPSPATDGFPPNLKLGEARSKFERRLPPSAQNITYKSYTMVQYRECQRLNAI